MRDAVKREPAGCVGLVSVTWLRWRPVSFFWPQRRAAEGAGGPSGGSSQRSFLQRRGGDGMPPPLTAIRLFHGHSFDLASSFSQEKRAFFFLAIILEGSIVEVGKLVLLSCSLPPIFLEEYADFSRRYAMEWDG